MNRLPTLLAWGCVPALEHAVPTLREADLLPLTDRYRHHFLAAENEIVLFDGVPAMLAALQGRRSLARGGDG